MVCPIGSLKMVVWVPSRNIFVEIFFCFAYFMWVVPVKSIHIWSIGKPNESVDMRRSTVLAFISILMIFRLQKIFNHFLTKGSKAKVQLQYRDMWVLDDIAGTCCDILILSQHTIQTTHNLNFKDFFA